VNRPPRILVIDDSRSVGDILLCALEQEGCVAVTALSAETGLQLARELRPDVIALDVGLGCELIGILRNDPATRDVPIIALAAPARGLPPMLSAKVQRVFGEPFYPAEVVTAVMETLERPARLGR
jgi:CheY-like chemotaxis protein